MTKPFALDAQQEAVQATMGQTFQVALTGAEIADIQWALFGMSQDTGNPATLTLCNRLRAIIGAGPMPTPDAA